MNWIRWHATSEASSGDSRPRLSSRAKLDSFATRGKLKQYNSSDFVLSRKLLILFY